MILILLRIKNIKKQNKNIEHILEKCPKNVDFLLLR